MKQILLFMFVAVIVFNLPVMGQIEKKQLYEEKIVTYTHMRNGGITMAAIGSGLVIAGTITLASIPDYYWHGDNYGDDYVDYSFRAVGGIIMTGIGIGLAAGGITLASIGGHKISQYRQRLNNLSVGVIYTPNRQGLTLTYRF